MPGECRFPVFADRQKKYIVAMPVEMFLELYAAAKENKAHSLTVSKQKKVAVQ
jgi:hypothetical protein